jgi:hypothetical protein
MITAAKMIRVTRKGGAVTHLALTSGVPSLCGRVALFGERVPADRLCKTCARIAKVADSEGEWTDAQRVFIALPRTAMQWEMLADVVSDYEGGMENDPSLIALYRAALAQRNYATTVITGALEKGGPRGDGNSMGYGKAKPTGATPNQRAALLRMAAFVDSLFSQLFALQGTEDDAETMVETMTDEWFNGLNRDAIDKQFKALSSLIDRLKRELAEAKTKARKEDAKTPPAEDGYYIRGESFVCVKWNRAKTGQYATIWNGTEWEWDGRLSRTIVNEIKAGKLAHMTPEDAKRFGDLYGSCFKCSRTLTDPESIAQGYGPVCAGRMGW